MKTARNRWRIILMLAVFLCGVCYPAFGGAGFAYADFYLDVAKSGGTSAIPGDVANDINFTITNEASDPQTITGVSLSFYDSGMIRISGGFSGSTTINTHESMNVNFKISVSKNASRSTFPYKLTVTTVSQGDAEYNYELRVDDRMSDYRFAIDFTHYTDPQEGFTAGSDNSITFEVFNKGNTTVRNAELSITLPDGMWVNNESNIINIGYLDTGEKKSRTFPITVDDDLGGKTYPVTVKLTGVDMSEENGSVEKTFYIPVVGGGAGKVKDIAIQDINMPSEVEADTDFTMTFSVRNTGDTVVKDLKAYAEMPDGLLNKSNATFAIDSINAGETKTYSVTMFAQKGSNSSYPVKVAVEPLSGSETGGPVQYASVFVRGGDNATTPQLIVDQYSYGGSSIMAGKEFFLNLGLFNTSAKELSNIKVTIISDDGTFVPVDSSNSFFIDKIEGNGHFTKSMRLSAKPSAEQKTTAITVKMSYEDGEGGEFTADDTISIPVMQVMRLSVDEIVPPYECYVGTPGYASLQFYNLGKTTLNNLMVNVEGDFDVMESNSYFAGNMEGGKSDNYTFTFVPREVGPMEGKVIFTYENIDGDRIVYEAPFVFNIMEAPVWDDYNPEPMPEGGVPWKLIIFGIALILAVAGTVIGLKIRKKRLHKKLEIQDAEFNAALDLDKNRG